MKNKWVIILIVTICLLFSEQAVETGLAAASRFAGEWKQVVADRKQIKQQKDAPLSAEYELAVAYANLGEIKEANQLFDKLGDKKWKKKLEKLVKEYSAGLEEQPKDIQLLNYLSFAYYIDERYQKAEDLFQQIIDLDPKNIWSYNYLAVVQHQLKNYKQAEKTLKKSMDIKENEYTHFLLGVNYYKKGNLFKAAYHVGKGKKAAKLFLNKD